MSLCLSCYDDKSKLAPKKATYTKLVFFPPLFNFLKTRLANCIQLGAQWFRGGPSDHRRAVTVITIRKSNLWDSRSLIIKNRGKKTPKTVTVFSNFLHRKKLTVFHE